MVLLQGLGNFHHTDFVHVCAEGQSISNLLRFGLQNRCTTASLALNLALHFALNLLLVYRALRGHGRGGAFKLRQLELPEPGFQEGAPFFRFVGALVELRGIAPPLLELSLHGSYRHRMVLQSFLLRAPVVSRIKPAKGSMLSAAALYDYESCQWPA